MTGTTTPDPLAAVIAFLRFRLAEDEAAIKAAMDVWYADGKPIRPLREIELWRRLIREYQIPPGTDAVYGGTERETGFRLALSFALKAKAMTYDGHPDYRHIEADIAAPALVPEGDVSGKSAATLTSADPPPPRGTVVRDDCGITWKRDYGEGYWLRTDSPDGDPESWAKIAGNYGPVVVLETAPDEPVV